MGCWGTHGLLGGLKPYGLLGDSWAAGGLKSYILKCWLVDCKTKDVYISHRISLTLSLLSF